MGSPLLIQSGSGELLRRIGLFERPMSENRLQELLFSHPALLPLGEIEAAASGSIPIVRELSTERGPLDLLYANAEGILTLVETKLWRNPQARREVVGQIIDYAASMSTWSYEDLEQAVRAAAELTDTRSLADRFRDTPGFDEARFVDAVSRNLRLGRFLLAIVGDGIQEGVERLAEYLQRRPELGFTLGLIELAVHKLPGAAEDEFLIYPRVVAQTEKIVRAVIEIDAVPRARVRIGEPADPTRDTAAKTSISQEDFFEKLAAETDHQSVDYARAIVESAPKHRVRVVWSKQSFALYSDAPEMEYSFSFGHITADGEIPIYILKKQCERLGLPDDIWQKYFEDTAALIPGAKWQWSDPTGMYYQVLTPGEEHPTLKQLGPKLVQWFAAIERAIDAIRQALGLK